MSDTAHAGGPKERWRILRADIDDLLKRFERDEIELKHRARAAVVDGYPSGGDGGRNSGVSDPTLRTVLTRSVAKNPAQRALECFEQGLRLLADAEKHRVDAFPPQPKISEPDGWCSSCLRISWHSPIDVQRYKAKKLCSWCGAFLANETHPFLPPEWMLVKRARGERIYSNDIDKAVREQREAAEREAISA